MARDVSFTDPYAQDYAELARQRKMAEILGQQAAEPMGDTQMVSGWAIPQSPLAGLNKIAQSALAAYGMHKTGEREKMLADKVREGGKKDATDFMAALQGTPEQLKPVAEGLEGPPQMVAPAVAGDKNKALAVALGSGNPMVQSAGSSLMANMLKDPTERFGKVMPHSFTPESLATYQQTGNYADLKPVAGGRDFGKVNPGQFTPESLARYAETGQFGDLVPFRSPVQVDQGDTKTLYDPGTGGTKAFPVAPKVTETPGYRGQVEQSVAEARASVEPRPKLGAGERYAADGQTVEAIPGSALYVKQKAAFAKDHGARLTMDTKTKQAIAKIDYILDKKNRDAFNSHFGGYNAYATRLLPGKTQDVGVKIESLKSDMKLLGLDIIRGGGSIGMMTEREWPIVQDMIDRIDPRMGEAAAMEAFENIKTYITQIKNNADEVYQSEWGNSQFNKPSKPKIDDLWGNP